MARRTAILEPMTPKARLSAVIKKTRDIMRKDAGLNGDLDRIPQISWILFLKCFDDLEQKLEMTEKKYRPVIEPPHRWRDWAADADKGRTGDELLKFVNNGLLPGLRKLSGADGNERRDAIASVFKETHNRMLSGYLLRDVVNELSKVNFNSSDDIHVLAHLYESMLREMRDAAGDSGEFYTPRPLIRFIVQQVDPRLGESVLDPAAGTGGFLVEAFEHIKAQVKSVEDRRRLMEKTLFGVEKKPQPYLLGMMNLLLHGIERPQLRRDNTLRHPIQKIPESAKADVIVTNPPFGGAEEEAIQKNFPETMRTAETAQLFLQYIMRTLKPGGRCGMVVPNGLLSERGVCSRIKRDLLENFNLHTVVRLPEGVFEPYTSIPTNLLFFEKTGATKEIWFYEVQPPEGRKKYTKTMPIRFEEFADCQAWWGGPTRSGRKPGEYAWRVRVEELIGSEANNGIVNLDIRNPHQERNTESKSPTEVVDQLLISHETLVKRLMIVKQGARTTESRPQKSTLLERFLSQRREFVLLDDAISYRRLCVQLHGKGIVPRDTVYGVDVKTKKQQITRTNDLVVAEIDAKVGGFGICPPELSGGIVNTHYFTFEINKEICRPMWLDLCIRAGVLERQVAARGSANYAAIRPQDVLELEIPLSEPDEQDRILTKMRDLAAVMEEVRGMTRLASDLERIMRTNAVAGKL